MVGTDISADQLAIARQRRQVGRLVQADGGAVPFADGSFDAVYAAFIHTDVDDWSAAAAQAGRLVRPGGRVLYVGTHPCFVGPFSRYPGQAPRTCSRLSPDAPHPRGTGVGRRTPQASGHAARPARHAAERLASGWTAARTR